MPLSGEISAKLHDQIRISNSVRSYVPEAEESLARVGHPDHASEISSDLDGLRNPVPKAQRARRIGVSGRLRRFFLFPSLLPLSLFRRSDLPKMF